jgi:hypothetical protein
MTRCDAVYMITRDAVRQLSLRSVERTMTNDCTGNGVERSGLGPIRSTIQ